MEQQSLDDSISVYDIVTEYFKSIFETCCKKIPLKVLQFVDNAPGREPKLSDTDVQWD